MKFLILICLLFSSCSHEKVDPIITPPVVAETVPPEAGLAQILLMVQTSTLAQYKFKDRSKAPLGYLKGITLSFAQELCSPSLPSTGNSETDALVYYNLQGQSDILTYSFLIGLGMRESSGKYCEGRDMSASNVASVSAEAGMFQTSYDAGTASKYLTASDRKCFLEVFKEGVDQSKCNPKNYGSGVALEFQKKSKECPTFAVRVAADTIRVKRKHYGPINRKEVEYRAEAVELLGQVKEVIKNNPAICKLL